MKYQSRCCWQHGFEFRNLCAASGVHNGERYDYAEIIDENIHPVGTIPQSFKDRAKVAFARLNG